MRILATDYFDEVGCWLRKNNFAKYAELIKAKGVTQLKELGSAVKRADIKKVDGCCLSNSECVDRVRDG